MWCIGQLTPLFEAYRMLLVESEMPVNKVGKVVGEYPKRIWTVFNYWLGVAYEAADHSGITTLGILENREYPIEMEITANAVRIKKKEAVAGRVQPERSYPE